MPETQDEKPFIVQSSELDVTATVAAIDHDARTVVLTLEDGEQQEFTVSEDAVNFKQASVGDLVTLTFFNNITIEVVDGADMVAGDASLEMEVQAEEDEMPGGAISRTDVWIYMVEAINLEDNTFVLKNAEGKTHEFLAEDPENLRRSAVGDAVIVSITSAVAIDVAKATAAE